MVATDDDVDDDVLTTGDFYAEGDDQLIGENTVLLTGEDFDSDGIANFGFDLNENEVLDADEVFERPIACGASAVTSPTSPRLRPTTMMTSRWRICAMSPHTIVVHA